MTSQKFSKRSSATSVANERPIKKLKTTVKSNDSIPTKTDKKRQITKIQSNEKLLATSQSINDTQTSINSIDVEQKQRTLSTDSLVTLFTQGLQQNDSTLLDKALYCRDDKIIDKAVRTLPNSILLPLVDYLNKYLYQNAEKGLIASKWLKSILNTHSSYLMTHSEITERLRPMYELIESYTKVYPKLARLHGKLSLLASQINNHSKKLPNDDIKLSTQTPLIFEDVSDDDIDGDQTQDELIPSPSEYDDYSGLSDDLDLGMNNEDEVEDINESDTDVGYF